ncbi:MAG: IS1634 family transposase [Bacteroidetes bacterium]|nr:IS1634 family transposase [Bacteroidota bacterium]
METETSLYSTQRMDHLGLVSGIVQDLGLVELIDAQVISDPKSRLSYGQVVLAMLINGLGFTTRPMYLSPQFFETKPVDLLIGPGICASDLNEYQFGKTLDAIYSYGCTQLFSTLSSTIFLQEGLGMRIGHYDTTSLSVHGQGYESADEQAIQITFGYSKDHRQDLRQWMIGLMVEPSHGIPWFFQALDGNTSDKTHFQAVISRLEAQAQLGEDSMFLIADSALFTEEGLKEIDKVDYLTRVPHNFGQAKTLLSQYHQTDLPASVIEGYRWKEEEVEIFGRKMRWLLVFSEQAYQRETKTLERKVVKQEEELADQLGKLARRSFGCQPDAEKALNRLIKQYSYLQLDQVSYTSKNKSAKVGRPKTGQSLSKVWKVKASAKRDAQAIKEKQARLGKFILATNIMDQQKLPSAQILTHYKNQQQPEKGFRFLKSPLCMADALFLNKPERIEALGMVMCLALMVYALGERKLRKGLAEVEETVPDQKGKPTQKPTLRWIFQCFEGISLLQIQLPGQQVQRQMLNLNVLHKQVIAIFGATAEKIYLLDFSP